MEGARVVARRARRQHSSYAFFSKLCPFRGGVLSMAAEIQRQRSYVNLHGHVILRFMLLVSGNLAMLYF